MLFVQAEALLKEIIDTIPFLATIGLHLVRWYMALRHRQLIDLRQTFSLVQRETGFSRAGLLKLLWDFVVLLEGIPDGFGLLEKLYAGAELPAFGKGYRAYVHGDLLQAKVRRAWQLEARPAAEEQALMVEFLGTCPNYPLQILKAWTRPTADTIVRRERVLRLLGPGGEKILDIGCSVNPWSTEYSQRSHFMVGLDLSHISLRMAGFLHP